VFTDLAVAIAEGATTIGGIDTLSHQGDLFGPLAVSQPGCALPFHRVSFSRRDRPCSERHGPITLAQSHVIVRCHGLLVRSSWRAGPEHDAGETEARSDVMQLIVSVGRQDKPGIGAGIPAKKARL
jgi:hypothetical protein